MNGKTARNVVILLVAGIAFLELGVATKFGSIWALAFQGSLGSEPAKPIVSSGNTSQSTAAHEATNAQNSST